MIVEGAAQLLGFGEQRLARGAAARTMVQDLRELVIDLDATLVEVHPDEDGAGPMAL